MTGGRDHGQGVVREYGNSSWRSFLAPIKWRYSQNHNGILSPKYRQLASKKGDKQSFFWRGTRRGGQGENKPKF
ncbi:hypothetical protein CEXT_344881 [Caerostris extrusa]|uniref:Uncharacterized protein n=1 Tax=Caerostris extrusa TaxID=172846 RepID=A0AAV4UBC3_CAEEX|nr:hypothetical protein CEXT_344881 [Caerostris extrusa]